MREDFDTANEVLPAIPKESRARVAHFLEKQGFKKQALAVTTDPEHQFDLALQVKSRNTSKFMSNKHFYSSANSIKLFKSQQKLTLWRNGDRSQIWQLRNVNSNWLQKHSEKLKTMVDSFSLRPQAEIKPLFNIQLKVCVFIKAIQDPCHESILILFIQMLKKKINSMLHFYQIC